MRDFTLIFGCMFAGKTTRLIELFNESGVGEDEKIAIKPLLDKRFDAYKINTHSGIQMTGHRIGKPEEIYPLIGEKIKEVYIDEIQFFEPSISNIIFDLQLQQIKIVAAGLDKDFLNRDFGAIPKLMVLATDRIELHARCQICGSAAGYTFRKTESNELLLVGDKSLYEPRCKAHWEEGMSETNEFRKA